VRKRRGTREMRETRRKFENPLPIAHCPLPNSPRTAAELHGYIDYKANLNGSLATKVPAHYTSQSCPKCGHTSKANRPNKGLLFRCECCNRELHSDLVGARNIAMRTLLVRQDWTSTGTLSMCPDVSGNEAKAEVLQRFSSFAVEPRYKPPRSAVLRERGG
jgi:putative transposase